jgi:hypothetical protein
VKPSPPLIKEEEVFRGIFAYVSDERKEEIFR